MVRQYEVVMNKFDKNAFYPGTTVGQIASALVGNDKRKQKPCIKQLNHAVKHRRIIRVVELETGRIGYVSTVGFRQGFGKVYDRPPARKSEVTRQRGRKDKVRAPRSTAKRDVRLALAAA